MAVPDIVYSELLRAVTEPIGTTLGSGGQRWTLTSRTELDSNVLEVTAVKASGAGTGTVLHAILHVGGPGVVKIPRAWVEGSTDKFRWRPLDGWFVAGTI